MFESEEYYIPTVCAAVWTGRLLEIHPAGNITAHVLFTVQLSPKNNDVSASVDGYNTDKLCTTCIKLCCVRWMEEAEAYNKHTDSHTHARPHTLHWLFCFLCVHVFWIIEVARDLLNSQIYFQHLEQHCPSLHSLRTQAARSELTLFPWFFFSVLLNRAYITQHLKRIAQTRGEGDVKKMHLE